LKCRKV